MHKVLSEQWVEVPDAPSYYVSNYGEIINKFNEKELKGTVDPETGIRSVHLIMADGKHRRIAVHRVVASAFMAEYQPKKRVSHRSDDKTDNSVGNLIIGPKHVLR